MKKKKKEKNSRVGCRQKTIEMRVKDKKKDDKQIYKEEKMNRFRKRVFLRCIEQPLYLIKQT